jgi:RNA 3'-terminal phosphate cyclase (ATP)
MIVIDGSQGEGGGQILRSSLALAILTRTPFKMERIRAGRDQPGLRPQHLTAVLAAKDVANADVTGAEVGSRDLTFRPRSVQGGHRTFSVGTAGSATLVLQTILPALLRAREPSTLVLEGGTHNSAAPPFEFLKESFLPLLAKMGAKVQATLVRPGFYPAGGGRIEVKIEPSELGALELEERGALVARRAIAHSSGLPPAVAERELRVSKERLALGRDETVRMDWDEAFGPGNAVNVVHRFEHVTIVTSGFGERGARPDEVAERAIGPMLRYLETKAAACDHLADQLLLPMAMGRGGTFTTTEPTEHTETQIQVLKQFLGGEVELNTTDEKTWTVTMRGALV